MRFKDQVVVVTGGSRGIGRAIVRAFAAEGARVVFCYRSRETEAQACLDVLEGEGHAAFCVDIADAVAVKRFADEVTGTMGKIDVLVHNAAVHEHHPIDRVSYKDWQAEWQRTLDTNLTGAANLTYCVAQHMMQRRSGSIVFVGSRGAFRGEPQQPAYGAGKAALHAFGQSMAQALAPYHIGVSIVAPGFVETEMVTHLLSGADGDAIRTQSPFGRVARPEEVAHAVLFLADQASIWCSGAILDCNGASYLR